MRQCTEELQTFRMFADDEQRLEIAERGSQGERVSQIF